MKILAAALLVATLLGLTLFLKRPHKDSPDVVTDPLPSTSFEIDFQYGVEAKNELDTFHKTFTKDLVMNPPATTSLELSSDKLESLRQKLDELKVFEPEPDVPNRLFADPCESYDLTVQTGDLQEHLTWNGCTQGVNAKLQALAAYVQATVSQTPEYQALPERVGGYE